MLAITLNQELAVQTVSHPTHQEGEALLKIRLAGICNTDLELIKGYMGFSGILGHEFVAEIVDGIPDKIGQRVVGEINVACGHCDYCDRGIKSHCRNRTTVGIDRHDGAFAEYMTLAIDNFYEIPDSISDEQAVFAEPLAAACQILEQISITSDDTVIIIGAGKLGLLCAQVIKLTGANLSVIVRRERQAELLGKWGIKAVYRDELDSNQASIVVDCTGSEAGFADALDLVAPLGTLVLKSTYEGLPKANLTRIAIDEITLIGSRCGSFTQALELLASNQVDVESMIDATYPLESGIEAFQFAQKKGVLKVMLKP